MRNSGQRKSNSESHDQKRGGRYKTFSDARASMREKLHNKILAKRILKQARKKRGSYTWKARAGLSRKLTLKAHHWGGFMYVSLIDKQKEKQDCTLVGTQVYVTSTGFSSHYLSHK